MSQLASGVADLGRALGFLRQHPRMWGWVVAPAVVTLVLLAALIAGIWYSIDPLIDSLVRRLPPWLGDAAGWGAWFVVVAALAIGGWLIFVSLAGMVAGPFNELLSEAIEKTLTGRPARPFSAIGFVRGALRGIGHGVRRLIVFALGAAVVFALAFVPVVGTTAALVLGALIASRAAAYDSYDAVLSRRDLAYRAKLAFLRRHRARTLGLGLAVAGLLVVPGLNLLALGLGATAATLASRELATR
ncbi:MAG: EI24 domain-containing protein [Kofleriaceae bacterium]